MINWNRRTGSGGAWSGSDGSSGSRHVWIGNRQWPCDGGRIARGIGGALRDRFCASLPRRCRRSNSVHGLAILAALAVAILALDVPATAAVAEPVAMVAHAGGGVDGEPYWNSVEALERNYAAGFRVFEVDFHWTRDRKLVLLHDWKQTFRRHFKPYDPPLLRRLIARAMRRPALPPLAEFLRLGKPDGPTPTDLAGLARWLAAHPDARIVTDVKKHNLRALGRIAERYPELVPRFIPQVFSFAEYAPAKALGYRYVILTLYRTQAADNRVVAFAGRERPYAVTMPAERAARGDLARRLQSLGVFVYAHTVNDRAVLNELAARGVSGFYTDFLGAAPASTND